MVTYKGYEAKQAPNHHVWITKDNRVVLHAQCHEPKTDDELREMVDNYIELTENDILSSYNNDTKKENER